MRNSFIAPVKKNASQGLISPVKYTFLRQIAKNTLLKKLQSLPFGCLDWYDGNDHYRFGQARKGEPHAQISVNDPEMYVDIVLSGSLGAAESYMTGDWDSEDLTQVIRLFARNLSFLESLESSWAALHKYILPVLNRLRRNTLKGSRRNIAAHYDLGNDFFAAFLDQTMMYSSALFDERHLSQTPFEAYANLDYLPEILSDASQRKLRTICEGLNLSQDDHVIEIGTGWGGFAIYAASHYQCRVTTTTISQEQYRYACEQVKQLGLGHLVTVLNKDYRELIASDAYRGGFDKLVSIEMIEAVGWEYYPAFFSVCSQLLKDDGLAMIQAITIAEQRYEKAKNEVDFIKRYIFPGSCIPSISALLNASGKASDLRMIKQTDFGEHYALTLNAWHQNLRSNWQIF